MKNVFRFPIVAIAIALSVTACKGNKSGSAADSAKTDSSTSMKSSSDTTMKVDHCKTCHRYLSG